MDKGKNHFLLIRTITLRLKGQIEFIHLNFDNVQYDPIHYFMHLQGDGLYHATYDATGCGDGTTGTGGSGDGYGTGDRRL